MADKSPVPIEEVKRIVRERKKEEMTGMERSAAVYGAGTQRGGKGKEEKKQDSKTQQADFVKGTLKMIEKYFPDLAKDLKRAEMKMDAPRFISFALMISVMFAVVISMAGLLLLPMIGMPAYFALAVMPFLFLAIFFWIMHYPNVKMAQKEREMDKDVLFAGRDMVIALKSGVPLFNAMVNVSKNYGIASVEFAKIIERIQGGVPAEVALQESSDMNSSKPFRQILLQMITSMRSGADMAVALEIVLNQISQEQVIALKRYGQKLNPITMFYMLFGIILPSLGISIGIILTSFISLKIDFGMLIVILMLLGILQYIFLAMIKSSRPNFEV